MIDTEVRRAEDRGHTRMGWLDSRHTFSFGSYHDPAHMGFRALRVINDDRIRAGSGFGAHPHRNMEILTWVLEGALRHEDSLGSAQLLQAGEVQVMTAGRGIVHSEMNGAPQETHFLQVWIEPRETGLPPAYAQQPLPGGDGLHLIASPDGPLTLHQDVRVFAGRLAGMFTHELAPGRYGWVHVARGEVRLDGETLKAGDGAPLTGSVTLTADGADVLFFDLN